MNAISYTSSIWLSVLLALNAAAAFQWSPSPQNGEVLYYCANQSVTIAWDYTLAEGDVISSTVWNFHGHSKEMVAASVGSIFFATALFSQRVQHVPRAGILLRHVTTADTGRYSVKVTGSDSSGNIFSLVRTALLQVGDALMTTDHELHARQQPVPEWSMVTYVWHTVLTCGTFTYLADPPVRVEWQTPEGQTVNSTMYYQGLFKLHLPNPVVEGTYSCIISAPTQNASCTHRNWQQAHVTVDGVLGRLAVIEAGVHETSRRLTGQETEISQIFSKLDRLKAKGNQKDAETSNLTSKLEILETDFYILKDHSPPTIAFSAKLSENRTTSLVLSRVQMNHGNAYSSSTGKFTAPVDGIYHFSAMTAAMRNTNHVGMYLKTSIKGPQLLSWTHSDGVYKTTSLQGAINLERGEQVWLQPFHTGTIFWGQHYTDFSGFLLFRDD